MQNAKSAVKDFLGKDGKHDTTVHQTHAPAVTNETVNRHHHEHVTTATDREVHQDHYHTSVLPVNHTEKLDETHHHKMAPVEHRKFEHGNDEDVQRRLQTEGAKFKDTTTHGETKHTSSVQPAVTGEHIHHHVHEKIQPVINRQTIEPHVTHHTVPVHEVHHSAAQHHEASALPAMSMSEFTKKHGDGLSSKEPTTQFFQGEPRDATGHVPYRDGDASGNFRKTGHVDQHGTGAATGAAAGGLAGHHHDNTTSSGLGSDRGLSGTTGSDRGLSGSTGSGLTGSHHQTGTSGLTGSNTTGTSGLTGNTTTGSSGLTGHHGTGSGLTGSNTTGTSGYGNTSSTGRGIDSTNSANLGTTSSNTSSSTTGKPSLIDRINPFKDTDGDGKKGMMD